MNDNIVSTLNRLLADSYYLYLKTQNFHWNVEGSNFQSLHVLFEEQYKDLALAIDEIAERIRTFGKKAPANFDTYSKLSSISNGDENTDSVSMIKDLLKGQETIIKTLNDVIEAATISKNEATIDLAVSRIKIHEKNIWMLKSSL